LILIWIHRKGALETLHHLKAFAGRQHFNDFDATTSNIDAD
jgi:hypothetical protein